MPTEMGEYLVGAYLKLVKNCDFVDYNVRPSGGKMAGLDEFDVIGIHVASKTAYMCEVMTHVRGLLYGSNEGTLDRVKEKYRKQQKYARSHLSTFENFVFMFWSPNVPKGILTRGFASIEGLQFVVNGEYKRVVEELRARAKNEQQDTGNPVFRVFQILGALRE